MNRAYTSTQGVERPFRGMILFVWRDKAVMNGAYELQRMELNDHFPA